MARTDGAAGPASLLWIGTATTLVRACGFTLLTDPNFLHAGQRVHLGWGLLSKRLHDPALQVGDLPPLDAVVLSHFHGDHWDRVATRSLDRDVPVITTRHAARRLRPRGFRRAVGLRIWEAAHLSRDGVDLSVTALPGRHAPGPAQALLPPVMGTMLEFSEGGRLLLRLYQTGDTLLFEGLDEIPRRYPDIDVGVLHLGGTTLPGGLVVTMDGAMGAELVQRVRPGIAVPVHHGDYTVFRSPLQDFLTAAQERGLADRVRAVERGGAVELPLRGPA
ncbi:MBL fold metallo-hydrolase [Quadrisphaera sp. DSM 44207]|uniref:MBL fold metallo-hydrolase n=1 Tax=Quadrisphaera sp. DSM 44207 TaxID=1881057 RepID=UPI00087EA97E|nr:MBL fold metallo-hydrolase [Quadrisphaera sp. DSM 44207]SDQ74366.1 L-ascorbate metabolism protein UlaG, beta-lactamase superfamily [Quadrisphaera sp. DSM 44207]